MASAVPHHRFREDARRRGSGNAHQISQNVLIAAGCLSRSFGDTNAANFSRESINIYHYGYLLKRSNVPAQDPATAIVSFSTPQFKVPPPSPEFESYTNTPDNSTRENVTVNSAATNYPRNNKTSSNFVEDSLGKATRMASDFFGCSLKPEPRLAIGISSYSENSFDLSENDQPCTSLPNSTISDQSRLRSSRIDIPTSKLPISSKSFASRSAKVLTTVSSASNAPSHLNAGSSLSPLDFIDPKDGHLWRAKYCILENRNLYFYRNEEDAKSAKATSERISNLHSSKVSPSTMSSDFLSMSPIPRRYTNTSPSSSFNDQDVMWEKKVALDCVGAVRSAEDEYGQWSFTLVTSDEYNAVGKEDCLVLRAGSKEKMQEWLFQFHRSLASIVKDMVFYPHIKESTLRPPEVYYPLPGLPTQNTSVNSSIGMNHPQSTSLSFSPKYIQGMAVSQSLSHGHGRNGMHRRRLREKKSKPNHLRKSSFDLNLDSGPFVTNSAGGGTLSSTDDEATSDSMASKATPVETLDVFSCEFEDLTVKSRTPLVEVSSTPANEPTPSTGKYIPPHLRKKESMNSKYVPPHLRKQELKTLSLLSQEPSSVSAIETYEKGAGVDSPKFSLNRGAGRKSQDSDKMSGDPKSGKNDKVASHFMLGGCADQSHGSGSIMDQMFKKRSLKLGKDSTDSYGYSCASVSDSNSTSSLNWEVGAVSACGKRECNEDAYLIANDLMRLLEGRENEDDATRKSSNQGLFAIFDGHCGFQTARYAAEKLPLFLLTEIMKEKSSEDSLRSVFSKDVDIENMLLSAIGSLDKEFCDICSTDGREWGDCGATALVAMLSNESIYVANLGDSKGILSGCSSKQESVFPKTEGWIKLEEDEDESFHKTDCFWTETNTIHTPSLLNEKTRIEAANGWVTTEQELCISQIHNMVFEDKEVSNILRRWFSHRFENEGSAAAPGRLLTTARICGELAVSRALGDRDFKGSFNCPSSAESDQNESWWDGPTYLPYADNHNRRFQGDLVSSSPDVKVFKVGKEGAFNEFLLLACDGLWDVMDADDAVRIAKGLMFDQGWSAEDSAARLAEIAVHLGDRKSVV